MSEFKNLLLTCVSFSALAIVLCDSTGLAQTPSLITSAVDEGRLAAIPRSTHPLARREFDRGPAPDSLPMDRMLLVLKRSPERDVALNHLLDQLQMPSSPNYHQWLTPAQFGQQFGASDEDIQMIQAWLKGHGFQVRTVSAGRTIVEFSGNAGQVARAFHTSIHRFVVQGKEHWANANDQQIPLALAQAVAGVFTLHDFAAATQVSVENSHVVPFSQAGSIAPQFTVDPSVHYVTPGDYATIYNATPLYPATTGAGTTIAVVGRTDINLQDVVSFRSVFGLPANPPSMIVNGPDPGDLGGGEELEAVLDTSWAGALATGAKVDLVVSQSTSATDGVFLSETYIIDNNFANVMTESFGECEAAFTSAQEAALSSLAQQAAAQGITYTVSTGDSGSAGCDNFSTEVVATGPVSVNGLASTPYNVAVGGTQFNDNGTPTLYWNSTNAANYSSALSHIPELVWNANCTATSCKTGSILAGGGGASVYFTKPSWQTGVAGIPNDGARDLPDVSLTAAGNVPYLLCLAGSCSTASPGFYGVFGTSASAPVFASIVALINQRAGRQGQLASRLYSLAAAENLAACNGSSTAALPAANCVFNDVTVGTNAVPGEANYYTASETYPATVGYDLASGLGSVNIANLVNGWSVTAGIPNASLSPTSLAFAAQNTGTTSSPQSVTLSNTGSAALLIAGITLEGANASDFAFSNSCGTAIAAGGTCSLPITFTPTSSGIRSANLTVTDSSGNVAGSIQSVALIGTGGTAMSTGVSATYSGLDVVTKGTWTGKYGAEGQIIADGLNKAPSYASVNFTSASTYLWSNSSSDPRALQVANASTARIASTYFSPTAFTIDVNLTDGNAHKLALYLFDWDSLGRAETISILNATSRAVLDTESFSSFATAVYATWVVKGHVQIQVTRTAGANAVVSALFFDPAGSASTGSASASYSGLDGITQGTWTGKYGVDGQVIADGLNNVPSYATVSLTSDSAYLWSTSTGDLRMLQTAGGATSRIASTYYSPTLLTADVNLKDGNAHRISLYFCDWDYYGRAETISLFDASSGALLDTETLTAFTKGVYAVWTVKGHVRIQVTRTAGINAIMNAVFFN